MAESEEKLETLQALPPSKWPQQVQAAHALKVALASSITPSQDDLASSTVGITGLDPNFETTSEPVGDSYRIVS